MIVAGDGEGQVEECVHEQQELDGDGPGGRLSTARLHWGRVASLVWILFALQTLALVINVQCLNENLVSGLITLICFNRRTYCFWEKFFGQKLAAPILLIFFLQQATNVLNLSRYEHLNSSSHSSTTKQILYQDPGNRCHREPPITTFIVKRHIPKHQPGALSAANIAHGGTALYTGLVCTVKHGSCHHRLLRRGQRPVCRAILRALPTDRLDPMRSLGLCADVICPLCTEMTTAEMEICVLSVWLELNMAEQGWLELRRCKICTPSLRDGSCIFCLPAGLQRSMGCSS